MPELPPSQLILSPHLDDAVLSCFALLQRPQPADVITVFGGEPNPPTLGVWDELCGFASSAQLMAARREEDAFVFAGTPHRVSALDLLELQYAGGERSASDAAAVSATIEDWRRRLADEGLMALPAGAGLMPGRMRGWIDRVARRHRILRHPDHLFVRDVGLRTARSLPQVSVLLYEELPYLLGRGADREAALTARRAGLKAKPLRLAVDRDEKARRIGAYASQVPHFCLDGTRLDVAQSLPEVERYWLLQ